MLRSQPSRDATSGEDYLSPEERNKRARAKREQAIERGLTPDWFHRRGDLCIPAGFRVAVIGAGVRNTLAQRSSAPVSPSIFSDPSG